MFIPSFQNIGCKTVQAFIAGLSAGASLPALPMISVDSDPPDPLPPPACPLCSAAMRITDRGTYSVIYSCRPCRVIIQYPCEPDRRISRSAIRQAATPRFKRLASLV